MNTFIALVALISGCLLFYIAFRLLIQIKKYQFENRTDGGVVKYNDYSDVMKMNGKKMLTTLLIIVSLILIVVGLSFAITSR
jgi:hypothetical protein